MKNRRLSRIIDRYIYVATSQQDSSLQTGYLWFFLSAVVVGGFIILSQMGIAS